MLKLIQRANARNDRGLEMLIESLYDDLLTTKLHCLENLLGIKAPTIFHFLSMTRGIM